MEEKDLKDSVPLGKVIAVVVGFMLVLAVEVTACNGCSSLTKCPETPKEKEKSVAIVIM